MVELISLKFVRMIQSVMENDWTESDYSADDGNDSDSSCAMSQSAYDKAMFDLYNPKK